MLGYILNPLNIYLVFVMYKITPSSGIGCEFLAMHLGLYFNLLLLATSIGAVVDYIGLQSTASIVSSYYYTSTTASFPSSFWSIHIQLNLWFNSTSSFNLGSNMDLGLGWFYWLDYIESVYICSLRSLSSRNVEYILKFGFWLSWFCLV